MSLKKLVLALAATMAINGCSANIEAPWTPPRLEDPFRLERSDFLYNQREAYVSTPPLKTSTESMPYTTSTTYEK